MSRPQMHVVDPHTGESDPAEIRRVFDAQQATALAWRESTIAERIADETGTGRGLGHTINVPMPLRADDDLYVSALASTMERIRAFGPSMLIVSLGLDTFITDPICDLSVTTEGFRRCGATVAGLSLPTVVLQEGGYDVEHLGANVVAWLEGVGA
mgnify:CR=1 FL=1